MAKAIIVGFHGQDGSYLSEQLAESGVEVIGVTKKNIIKPEGQTIGEIDITNKKEVCRLIADISPDYIYYLAGVHHSAQDTPSQENDLVSMSLTVHVTAFLHFLNCIRKYNKDIKIFYAASSHIFGNPLTSPQNETTPFNPTSAYGITKATGVNICRLYRKEYNVFCSSGFLYNHESPRRLNKFVSKKIVSNAVSIYLGKERQLVLGDLSAAIDWGYAPDYTRAMKLIMESERPGDFIISSGELHTIEDFVSTTFHTLQLDWQDHVVIDPELVKFGNRHPALFGVNHKLRETTGWKPGTSFKEMISIMVDDELRHQENEDG